ncbi:tetratricopeptide repeat protein [Candidatus Gracilibacteria bacterium]|nr:tetratricopeptide repeat protein [Candidatus Gracilibacteria bacterium]
MQLVAEGQPETALPLLQAAVADAEAIADSETELMGECATALGSLLQERGDFARALGAYARARAIARTLHDRPREMALLGTEFSMLHHQRHYREALDSAQQMQQIGREIREETGDGIFESVGLLFTMVVLVGQWRCTEALPLGQQALAIARDDERFNVAGAVFFNNGECSFIQQRYDEALTFYQQARDASRARGDYASELLALEGIAKIHRAQMRYDAALAVLQQAQQRAREVADRAKEASVIGAIGRIYREQGRYDLALDLAQQAVQITREQRDRSGEAFQLLYTGEIYSAQRRYEEAQESYRQVVAIARALQLPDVEAFALTRIGRDYEAQQRFAAALDARLQAVDVLDTVRAAAGSEAARMGVGRPEFLHLHQPGLAGSPTRAGRAGVCAQRTWAITRLFRQPGERCDRTARRHGQQPVSARTRDCACRAAGADCAYHGACAEQPCRCAGSGPGSAGGADAGRAYRRCAGDRSTRRAAGRACARSYPGTAHTGGSAGAAASYDDYGRLLDRRRR